MSMLQFIKYYILCPRELSLTQLVGTLHNLCRGQGKKKYYIFFKKQFIKYRLLTFFTQSYRIGKHDLFLSSNNISIAFVQIKLYVSITINIIIVKLPDDYNKLT